MNRFIGRTVVWLACWCAAGSAVAAQVDAEVAFDQWIVRVEQIVPREPKAFASNLPAQLAEAAESIDGWAALMGRFRTTANLDGALATMRNLLEAKRRIDRIIDTTLGLRA